MRWAAIFAVLLAQPAGWKPPAVRIQDEGTLQGYASTLNCTGAGISCSVGASVATVNVTGGGGGSASPGGVSGNVQINSTGTFGAYTGTTCSYAVKSLDANGAATCTAAPSIPADISAAHYVTTQAESGLSAEAVLPTCTGTDKLTFNGTTISCATDQTSAGGAYATVQEEASSLTQRSTLNFIGPAITAADNSGSARTDVTVVASGTGACAANQYVSTLNNGAAPTCAQVAYTQVSGTPTIPADVSGKKYLIQTADAALPNAQAMGALGTGLVLNTTATGVQSAYGGTSCTNQFPRSLNASGAATCAGVAIADLTATGTPSATTFLRGDNTWATPAGGGVAGTDKQIIYNNAGAYAGNANLTFDQTSGAVGIGAPTFLTNNPLGVAGNVNGFVQVAIQNKSAGTSASSDFVATADTGTNTSNFVDIGINSSTYSDASYTIGGALSGYLFSNGGDLTVGTQTAAKVLKLHTGGTLAANLRATLSDTALNLASGVGLQANGASGTTTQVLHGAASGSQTWSAVALGADVSGTLPVGNGGLGAAVTPAAGTIVYGSSGTAHAELAAGTAGQSLFSGGAAAPAWADAQKLVRLTSDYTNATTSMTNTALAWTSPAAVSRSAFICQLMVKSSTTTTGGQFDVNSSVAPTTITYGLTWVTGAGTAPGTGGTSAFVQATAAATALGPATTSLTTYTLWRLEGIIVHTASASTVTVRGKAPAAGTLTVGSGSNCQYYVL